MVGFRVIGGCNDSVHRRQIANITYSLACRESSAIKVDVASINLGNFAQILANRHNQNVADPAYETIARDAPNASHNIVCLFRKIPDTLFTGRARFIKGCAYTCRYQRSYADAVEKGVRTDGRFFRRPWNMFDMLNCCVHNTQFISAEAGYRDFHSDGVLYAFGGRSVCLSGLPGTGDGYAQLPQKKGSDVACPVTLCPRNARYRLAPGEFGNRPQRVYIIAEYL